MRFTGIDSARFNSTLQPSTDERFGKLGTRLRLIHVGRVDWIKRYDVLFAALEQVERRSPGRIGLVVIGSGSAACEQLVRTQANKANVLWIPQVANELIGPYYRACQVSVIASGNETSPLVVMEAMACGLAVVGPNAGGTGEMIRDRVTGLTFSDGDCFSLAEKLTELASNPVLVAQLSSNALCEAESFSVTEGARATVRRIERLVSDHRRTGARRRSRWQDLQGHFFFLFFALARLVGVIGVFVLHAFKKAQH